jgi:hypothetical protein
MITRETLRVLENELTFTRQINRSYDSYYAKAGAKIGNVLNVRLPVRFAYSQGQGLVLQDLTESSVPVVLNVQYQRSFAITSADLALSVDDFRKRFIEKAMKSMANQIDQDGLALYKTVNNEVGTPGTIPNTVQTYLDAGTLLSNEAAPLEDRCLTISPAMNGTIVGALTGLFNPQMKISDQYRKGMMTKDTVGFDWYMDQNCNLHTVGLQGGAPLTNAVVAQTGSSIISDGWSNSTQVLNRGDIIQVAGIFAVNPQNLQSFNTLANFVVTADVTSDGAGNATIPVQINGSGIIATGPYQNVTAALPDDTVITVNGASATKSQRGLAFHPDAFTFASADLPLYGGLDMGDRIADDQDLKMSIRVIRNYDINQDRAPLRMDLLGGWATLYPQLACRIAS